MRCTYFLLVAGMAAVSSAQLVTLTPGTGNLTTRASTAVHTEETVNAFSTPNFFEKSANATNIGGGGVANWDIRSNGLSNSAVLTSTSTEFEMDVFGAWSTTFNLLNTANSRTEMLVTYVTRFTLATDSLITLTNRHEGSAQPFLSRASNEQGLFRSNNSLVGFVSSQYNQPDSRQFMVTAGNYFVSTLVSLEIRPGHTGLVNQQILFRDKIHVQAVPEPLTMVTLAAGAAALIRRKNRR